MIEGNIYSEIFYGIGTAFKELGVMLVAIGILGAIVFLVWLGGKLWKTRGYGKGKEKNDFPKLYED